MEYVESPTVEAQQYLPLVGLDRQLCPVGSYEGKILAVVRYSLSCHLFNSGSVSDRGGAGSGI